MSRRAVVAVIGGGASGMAAAYFAARSGADVTLFEKNEKLGKKVYITGKGRCNLTNIAEHAEFLSQIVSNPKFMYSALRRFGSADVIALMEELGTPVKTERGGRVFPVSDHASDVIRAWEKGLGRQGVSVRLHTTVKDVSKKEDGSFFLCTDKGDACADAVILACGGLSYPTTGSDGDGYRFAEGLGHELTKRRPALVALHCADEWIAQVEGLSLRNVGLCIRTKKKALRLFGEMLFTAKGISGPMALSASSLIGRELEDGPLSAEVDLKPALSEQQLDVRVLREFEKSQNRAFHNAIRPLFPASFCPVAVSVSGIDADLAVNEVTRKQRQSFVRLVKAFPLTITGTEGYTGAVITQGGVCVKEIDPKTMESRLCPGLYITGELLDVDAMTGGYNLQIAWSTGYAAGTASAGARREEEA